MAWQWIEDITQKGKDLWDLAKEKLGFGDGWGEIFKFNLEQDANFDPTSMLNGDGLWLPDDETASHMKETIAGPSTGPVNLFLGIREVGTTSGQKELHAAWTWGRSTADIRETESYRVVWYYDNGSGKWQIESDDTINIPKDASAEEIEAKKQAWHSINANAVLYKVQVLPVSSTFEIQNGKTTIESTYWTSSWATSLVCNVSSINLTPPSTLNMEANGNTIKAIIDVSEEEAVYIKQVEIQIIEDRTRVYNTSRILVPINTAGGRGIYTFTAPPGHSYTFKARTVNGNISGRWSGLSSEVSSMVAPPKEIKVLKTKYDNERTSEDINRSYVHIEWTAVPGAESYTVEYTSRLQDFEQNSGNIQSVTVSAEEGFAPANYTDIQFGSISGDILGNEVYFRVRASKDGNISYPTPTKSLRMGTKPLPSTTWQSLSAATTETGSRVKLYWTHNTTDNSDMRICQVTIKMKNNPNFPAGTDPRQDDSMHTFTFTRVVKDGKPSIVYSGGATRINWERWKDVFPITGEDEIGHPWIGCASDDGSIMYMTVRCDSEFMANGGDIEWYVRTVGITNDASKPSVKRVVSVYPLPSATINLQEYEPDNPDDMMPLPDETGYPYPVLERYPLIILGEVNGYSTLQYCVSCTVKILAKESYDIIDPFGNKNTIVAGQKVYEQTFDETNKESRHMLLYYVTPADADLQNIRSYEVHMIAMFNTGLVAKEVVKNFTLKLDGANTIFVDGKVSIDKDTLSASVSPTVTNQDDKPVEGCTIDVYRKEYDGQFTEIAKGVTSAGDTYGPELVHLLPRASALFAGANYKQTYWPATGICYPDWTSDMAKGPGIHPPAQKWTIHLSDDGYYAENYWYDATTALPGMNTAGNTIHLEAGKRYRYALAEPSELNITLYDVNTSYAIPRDHYEEGYGTIYAGQTETTFVLNRSYDIYFAHGTFPKNSTVTVKGLSLREIVGATETFITDPHPALDFARYRLIARDPVSGYMAVHDTLPQPVGEKAIVIQWDEAWSDIDAFGNDIIGDPQVWAGSMLKLPYNIDISNTITKDITDVDYIGRKNSVAYYGTQVKETATWTTDIPRDDRQTIYMLRRLQKYMGDVYVREPSGIGYWAHIDVEFPINHLTVVTTVTLTITRVEGGM